MSSIKNIKKMLALLVCAVFLLQALPFAAFADETENVPNLPPQISEDDPEFKLLDLSERRAITGPRNHVEVDPTIVTKPKPGNFLITKKFIDFFPDPYFAAAISKAFGKSVNDTVTDAQLATVKGVDISETKMKSTEGIGYLVGVGDFSLWNNEIETVTADIAKLTNVTQFDLSDNNITTLPDNFDTINNAWYLNLSGQNLENIPESISKMKKLNRLDLSYCNLKTIPEYLSNVLVNGGPKPHAPGNTPGNHAGDIFLRNNQITEIPAVYLSLMNNGENISLCNQNATIADAKKFTNLDEITFEDSVPPIIAQLNGFINQRAFKNMGTQNYIAGSITATLNGQPTTLTLAQLLNDNFKGSQLFAKGDGVYDVEFNTKPEWPPYGDYAGYQASKYYHVHGKGHSYKYKVEISTGATLKNVIAGTGTSDNDLYDIALNGFIQGYFPNGINNLNDTQIKAMYLNGLVVNTVSEVAETTNLTANAIDAVVVEVILGKLESIKISGKAKTMSSKSDSFTITIKPSSQSSKTFAMTGASAAEYQIAVTGLLPHNLQNGIHSLTPLGISKLKQTGILYNNRTGEIRRLSQNAFNKLEITVTSGNIEKIDGKGTNITANGNAEPYEGTADKNPPPIG